MASMHARAPLLLCLLLGRHRGCHPRMAVGARGLVLCLRPVPGCAVPDLVPGLIRQQPPRSSPRKSTSVICISAPAACCRSVIGCHHPAARGACLHSRAVPRWSACAASWSEGRPVCSSTYAGCRRRRPCTTVLCSSAHGRPPGSCHSVASLPAWLSSTTDVLAPAVDGQPWNLLSRAQLRAQHQPPSDASSRLRLSGRRKGSVAGL